MPVDVLVFSKDRPWQLSEYIRTFKKYASGNYKIYCIYASSKDDYKSAYAEIVLKNNDIEFLKEDDFSGFNDCLDIIINELSENPYLMFGCDDVLFYDSFNLNAAEAALQYNYSFGYSLRLNPNIVYCQPAKMVSQQPKLSHHSKYDSYYDRREGTGDWNYPWELSASIYKKGTVKEFIKEIRLRWGEEGTANPNRLEAYGSMLAAANIPVQTHNNFCQKKPVCSTITINRVQEEYKNSVINEIPPETLIQYFWLGEQYHTDTYKKTVFASIHIGDFWIKK